MSNENIVKIHGKDYMTVAGRLELARKEIKSIDTEVIPHQTMAIVKATVTTDKGTFTGISAANPAKAIEKASPYEVAETSAVGRALGFAGYGSVESIASADEMQKAASSTSAEYGVCTVCGTDGLVPKVVDFSTKKYGKVMCYKCQTEQK